MEKNLPELEFDSFTTKLREDGIICSVVTKPCTCNLALAEEVSKSIEILAQGRPALLLRDINLLRSSTRAARAYWASPEYCRLIKAIALIAQSPTSRIVAAFYTGLNFPCAPIKTFSNEKDALKWLHTFS